MKNQAEDQREKDYTQSLKKLDTFKHWHELFRCICIMKKAIIYLRAGHSAFIWKQRDV